MNKKVLILSASPRKKGNSDILCDRFMDGASEAGNQVEKIFLGDKKINYCMGCLECQGNGRVCVQKDDMGEVLDKMIKADVIVMATPVYFYSMNAQMKVLIDRTCAGYTGFGDKKMYFIISAADEEKEAMESTLEGFRAFLRCLSNAKEAGIIYGLGVSNIGDINHTIAVKQAYEAGKTV